jgi:Beta-lactamase enzyme family
MASIGNPHLAAALVDTSTGCSSQFGDSDGFPTASTVKAEIMGAIFLSLQDQGIYSLDPTSDELIAAMIEESDNSATTTLYDDLGGGAVLQTYGRRLGMQTTDNVTYGWGGDITTPDDQLRLLSTLLVGGGILDARWVSEARHFMGSIVASQDWGVNTGVPDRSTVWLKNGWYYNDGSDWGPGDAWRVNSIGAVRLPNGRTYLLAVYGNEWASLEDGIAGIGTISSRVASVLDAPRHGPVVGIMPSQPGTDDGAVYNALAPTRVLDTRSNGGVVSADGQITVDVALGGLVPSAVAVNITAVGARSVGFVTAWADGFPEPDASVLNQQPGRAVADFAIVGVGANGKIRLKTSSATHLIVDLLGTFTPHPGPGAQGRYIAVTPARVLDTRNAGTPVGPGSSTVVPIVGRGGVPATDASAVVVNVTVTKASGDGFWTVWPSRTTRPNTSTLNLNAGETIANTAIVPLGADGAISVYSQSGGHLLVDVVGWITGPGAPAATAGRYVTFPAARRVADTRMGFGDVDRLTDDSTVTINADVPADATAVAAVLTIVNPGDDGFLTAFPVGAPRPNSSSANPSMEIGTWANAMMTGVTNGGFSLYSSGNTEAIVDISGWFTS